MAAGTCIPDMSIDKAIGSWKAAAFVAVASALTFPAAAAAHDPGLSSLHLRLTPDHIVAALSLAQVDAGRATGDFDLSVVEFALESVDVSLDGIRLHVVESHAIEEPSGPTIILTFDRVSGSRLAVHSAVPLRLARGHRELLVVQGMGGAVLTERMLDSRMDSVEFDLEVDRTAASTARQFLALGVRHILGGYDHLLFLAALLIRVERLRTVVKTVTAFTVAHSLTLAAAILGLVQVPAAVVEPVIAASIVYVGIENLVRARVDSRWQLTFAFGLIHGLGFAGALRELGVGVTGGEIVAPLASFNAGVEIGQLGMAAVLWPAIARVNARPALRIRLAPACSLLVVAAGSYWIVERTLLAGP